MCIPALNNFKGLLHAFSTIDNGNMSLVINQEKVGSDQVVDNRKKFFKKSGIDIKRAMTVWLEHGDNVVEAKEEWLGSTTLNKIDPPKADAVITNKTNTYLTLTIADCVPVIIYDPVKHTLGLVHAGWKGVDAEIVPKTVKELTKKYGSNPKDLIVGIGPCIGKENYIKDNFAENKKEAWGDYVKDVGNGKCSIDMVGYIKEQLLNSGIKDSNIYLSEIDTFKDKNFYSHYRDVQTEQGDQGRFICVVGMV